MDDCLTDEGESSESEEEQREDFYEVEAAVDRRWNGKMECFEYKVKWKGWSSKHNEWVAEEDVGNEVKRQYLQKMEDKKAKQRRMQVKDPSKGFIAPDNEIIEKTASDSSEDELSSEIDAEKPSSSNTMATKKEKKRSLPNDWSTSSGTGSYKRKRARRHDSTNVGLRSHKPRVLLMSSSSSDEDVKYLGRAVSAPSSEPPEPHISPAQGNSTFSPSYSPVADHMAPDVDGVRNTPLVRRASAEMSEEECFKEMRLRFRQDAEKFIRKRSAEERIYKDYLLTVPERVVALEADIFERFPQMSEYDRWCQRFSVVLQDPTNVLFQAIVYNHLSPTDILGLTWEQMEAPRFRIQPLKNPQLRWLGNRITERNT